MPKPSKFKLIIAVLIALIILCVSTAFATVSVSYPKFRAWDPATKNPLVGGKLYSYVPGTSTPRSTYTDIDCTVPNTNPIILDSNGEANVYISESYPVKMRLFNSANVLVWEIPELTPGTLWAYYPNEAGIYYSSVVYGGTQAALEAAITAVGAYEAALYLAPATWIISSNLVIPSNITIRPERGAILQIASGVTLTINGSLDAGLYQIFACIGTGVVTGLQRAKPEWFATNTTPGTTDMTAAINSAKNAASIVECANTTYGTTGGHSITTQQIVCSGKGKTIFKKLSGVSDIFTMTGAGKIQGCTIDCNSLAGHGIITSGNDGSIKDARIINSGGTSYALVPTGQRWTFEDLEFSNNYADIYMNGLYYSSFIRTKLLNPTSGTGLRFDIAVTDIEFFDTYFENANVNMNTYGIREIFFTKFKVRLDNDVLWWDGAYATGSEVASIYLRNFSIRKYKTGATTKPIFDLTTYQMTIENGSILNLAANAGWNVIKDTGTMNLRLQDITIESTNAWNFFETPGSDGTFTVADGINYTQGVTGEAKWRGNNCTISNSNINHTMNYASAQYNNFINIIGNIDLTTCSFPIWLVNCNTGTVTDPALNRVQNGVAYSSAASTGAGTVKMGSGNPGTSAGWLQIDKGDGSRVFIPYWTDDTP